MKDILQERATVDAVDTNSYVLAMLLKSDMGKALPFRAHEIAYRSKRSHVVEKDV